MLATAAVSLGAAEPQPASSSPPDLATAVEAYWSADYATAERQLRALDSSALALPEQVLLHRFLALTLLARSKGKEANAELLELFELAPGHEVGDNELSPSVAAAFRAARETVARQTQELAIAHQRSGNLDEATAGFEKVLQLDPGNRLARDLLAVVRAKVAGGHAAAAPAQCTPSRAWGGLSTKGTSCERRDFSADFELPVTVDRLTLIYDRHTYGPGKCWKVVVYDATDQIVHTFEDPAGRWLGKGEPARADRWQVVDLPAPRTISRVVMYAEDGHGLARHMAARVGKIAEDHFILALERRCP